MGAALLSAPALALAQLDVRRHLPTLSDGRITQRFVRSGLDGRPSGRAYGLIDAPFSDVMHVLTRFSSYARLVPTLREVQVTSRTSGVGQLHARGRAPLLGSYDVQLEAAISGHANGTHVIELRTPAGASPQMNIRITLSETPSRLRTVLAVDLALEMRHVPSRLVQRAHVNASVATVAAIRSRVRSLRGAGSTPGARFSCPA